MDVAGCLKDDLGAYTETKSFPNEMADFAIVQGLGQGKILIRANIPEAEIVNKAIDIVYNI